MRERDSFHSGFRFYLRCLSMLLQNGLALVREIRVHAQTRWPQRRCRREMVLRSLLLCRRKIINFHYTKTRKMHGCQDGWKTDADNDECHKSNQSLMALETWKLCHKLWIPRLPDINRRLWNLPWLMFLYYHFFYLHGINFIPKYSISLQLYEYSKHMNYFERIFCHK